MLKRWILSFAFCVLPILSSATPSSFLLTDTQGQSHSLAQYRGKWVLVNFWATWCSSCVAEIPALEAMHKSNANLVVLGIAADGQDTRRITQFAGKLGASYPIISADRQVISQFQPRGYPTTILYDPAGQPALVKEGSITRQDIETIIHALR
jgi:thiol-disulfide isomerase/thioredoxin